jgi:DNA-binding PadR family transcriptional regulator
MGHPGFNRHRSRPEGGERDEQWEQHRGGSGGPGGWGQWPGGRGRHGHGHGGPPPWVAGLFGLAQGESPRGPRARRGDVRAAILDVLATGPGPDAGGEPLNGYQVIQQIADKSNGAWRPSPGSVYPTIQQLQDEGLVETDDERGRRSLRLTEAGQAYVADNADELAGVWTPFESRRRAQETESAGLKPEIGQVMGAVWQIVTTGTDQQRRDAVEILVETRRKLYGLLADGDPYTEDDDEEDPA